MIWARGEILPDEALTIPCRDRTFEHGLGLFETLRTWGGQTPLLPRHLARLARSAESLGIPIDPSDLPDAEAVRRLLQGWRADALLRITLTGGISAEQGSTLWMRAAPIPAPSWAGSARVLLGRSPLSLSFGPLAQHKSLNYLARRMAYEEAIAEGFDEILLTTGSGITEGSRTNLFLIQGQRLTTLSLDSTIVPGIMRGLILELAPRCQLGIEEASYVARDDLWRADEVFLTNSVRGIIPVRSAVVHKLPGSQPRNWDAPGPWTRELMGALAKWLEPRSGS